MLTQRQRRPGERARVLEERRAAKRASATSVPELDEAKEAETETSSSAAALMVAAEAVLAETRETLEALTVSALQQTHAMIHRTETTAEGFFQTATTREQARKKQLDVLESMKVYEVYADDVPSGTRVMSGRSVETMKSQVDSARLEPHSDEGCFEGTATIQVCEGVVKVC